MRNLITSLLAAALSVGSASAGFELLEEHCAVCHNEEKAKGKFELAFLGDAPTADNLDRWLDSLDYVTSEEMPPEDESELSAEDRTTLVNFLEDKVRRFEGTSLTVAPTQRRMNNREFVNSVRDVLMIEDVGTHLPTANLIGDSLHHGFDTHADTLGFSRFHLEQYIEAVRKIVDATILSGERPATRTIKIPAQKIWGEMRAQNSGRTAHKGKGGVYDFLDPKTGAYFVDFKTVEHTGRYRIKLSATGKDRLVYDTEDTGFYHGDPIQIRIEFGDRTRTIDLPDEEVLKIELDEWLAAGTMPRIYNPTDAFTLRSNGNFKFQNQIAGEYLLANDPEEHQRQIDRRIAAGDSKINHWSTWVDYWKGARPQLFRAEIEGPIYESWPPQRQVALIGADPHIEAAADLLRPIAERAWRRSVRDGELDQFVALVEENEDSLGTIEAFKEGIVAILVSPAFLMLNTEDLEPDERFAAKLSYLLQSTAPDQHLRAGELVGTDAIRDTLIREIGEGRADAFLNAFPNAWLELNDINFMAPDPERYRFYHKKRLSEDMVAEVIRFFRYIVEENRPIPEMLSADYSFINADLATIYGVEGVEQDSTLRRVTFTDGRRGGLLGMGAFLSSTADSLGTSPIHRAVYVMENLMGIHPTPPPPDIAITEPDVRQAKTIKEILAAHTSDESCASCHKAIDPWGYAFENFDPTGAWRDVYVVPTEIETDENGEPVKLKRASKETTIPIDASARFRSGLAYENITDFREQILTDANRDRFVRCFIAKLLTYANGVEPVEADYVGIDDILKVSAEHDYRMVETIAATIDSPLFRER